MSGRANDINVDVSGNGSAGAVSEDGSTGDYTTQISNTTAELVTVSASVDGVDVGEVDIEFTPGNAVEISDLTIADSEIDLDGSTSVTATVLDANNNPVPDVTVSFSSDEPNRATVEGSSSTNSNGQATAQITGANDQAGDVVITASMNDSDANVDVSDSETVNLTVSAGTADAGTSSIEADPVDGLTADGSDASTLTITVRDGSNNELDGEDVFFSVTTGTGSLSSGPWSTDSNGQATATLTSTQANTVTVTGFLGSDASGEEIGTVDVEFIAGSASDMDILSDPEETPAGEAIRGSPTVKVMDSGLNGVGGIDVTVTEQGGYPFDGGETTVETNDSGEAAFDDLIIETANVDYRLVFSANGLDDEISNPFDITAAAGDPSNSSADVPDGTAGETTEITITVEDEFGNAVTGAEDDLVVEVTGDNTATPEVSESGTPGDYTASYTPTNAGTDNISIELNGTPISGSPFTSEVESTSAENVSIQQQPGETVAGQSVVGPPSALVTDGADNPVSGVEVTASLLGGTFANGNNITNSDVDGVAEFGNLVINDAGNYEIEFAADGVSENATTDPFEVISAAGDPSNSSADVPDGTAGETTEITITVEDEFGNAVTGAEDDLVVEVTGDNTATPEVSESGTPGDYTASYTPTNAGTDQIDITLGDDAISGSPFNSIISAGSASSFNFENISSPQTAGESFEITITAEDGSENTASSYNGTANLSTTAGTISPEEANFSNGTATLNVIVSETGTNETISADDGSISGISNEFEVESGGVDAENSNVSANPTNLEVGNNSTLTIELRDGSNNLVSGVENSDFTIDVSGNGTAGSVSESSAGTYSTDITNTTAETVTVTVTADGVELNDTAEIEFTSASTSMEIIEQPQDTRAGETMDPAPSVRIIDSLDKLYEGIEVTVDLDDGSFTEGVLTKSTNEEGEAAFDDLVITSAGRYRLVFSADGLSEITSDAFNVNPGVGNPNNTTAVVDDGIIDIESIITITVRDDYDNRVGGAASELFVEVSMNNSATPEIIETDTLGEYTAGYTPATTGEDTIEITLNNEQISGNLFSSQVTTSDD